MDCSYWLYYRLDRLRSPSLKYSRQQYGTLTGPRRLRPVRDRPGIFKHPRGSGSEGKPPPHKEDLLVAAKAALKRPQYLRHCESFLRSEVKRGKGRRRRQNPFQRRPVTQCSSSVPGAGPGESGIVPDPYTRWCGIENIS